MRSQEQRLYAYLDPQTALTTLQDGQLIFVDPVDEGLTPSLVARGYWEPWIEPVIRRLVRPGDRIIEVGANFGFYTLLMASLVGKTGHIETFEANARVMRLLRRSVHCNGHGGIVTAHQKIAADQNAPMTFASSVRWAGAGVIASGGRDFGDETLHDQVEAVRLDDAFPGQTFDFIRTDAEGSEVLILDGAMGILQRSPSIKLCIEWSPAMMRPRGDIAALANRLEAMGFKFWKIDNPTGLDPKPLRAAALPELEHGDLVVARELPHSVLYPLPRPTWKKVLRRLARWLELAAR